VFPIKNEHSNSQNEKSLCEPPFLDLGVMYTLYLLLIGKPTVDFLFVIIEFFHCLLRLGCHKRKSVEVGIFRGGGSLRG